MAREPDVALFKTASGSLACRQIFSDFLQSISIQRIPPERLSKLTTGEIFSCHIARLTKSVSNQILSPHVTLMSDSMALLEAYFKHEAFMALCQKGSRPLV